MSDLTVANTIRSQIGRMAFVMMGAKHLVGSDNFLQFSIGNNSKNVSKVRVTLEPSDTYRVTFYGRKEAVKSEETDVYVDSLHDCIERNTGLYLKF